ncbi:Lrp/AsnC family transcriptional regulator [Terrarubrum flagellatum]|uniref:Lrp/AsnC family transcriptional regulator n=1 Tax=Terrirubrum flagellatum TaxID=2895980 RepID=UPI0031454B9B
MSLSESDRQILAALQQDGAASLKDLAEKLNLSQSTLWRRVRDFEEAGVIAGRVTLLDPAKVGLSVCVFVHVNLRNHTTENRDAFERFTRDQPNILECFSVTGPHDYVLIVRAADVGAFEDFLMHRLLAQPSVASASSNVALRQLKYTTVLPI